MEIAGLDIYQNGNYYAIYTKQNIQIGLLLMPPDNQLLGDAGALNVICRAMAKRWGVGHKGS